MLGHEQLDQLHADALARQAVEPGTAVDAGGDPLRVGRALAVGGVEAEEPQDAQVVLGDARGGIADEAHAPRLDVGEPADIIVDRAVARRRQRIHREVAALGIAPPVAAEGDLGVAAEGFDVLAQGGDLERLLGGDDGDGAVLDAGRHRLEARRLHPANHLLGDGGGGDVDVAVRLADERVADGAADDAGLLAVAVEHGEQIGERRFPQPRRIEAARRVSHFVSPGTKLPSLSKWAGI